jgi:hypothetical protein
MNWNDATNNFSSMSLGLEAHARHQGKSYVATGVLNSNDCKDIAVHIILSTPLLSLSNDLLTSSDTAILLLCLSKMII